MQNNAKYEVDAKNTTSTYKLPPVHRLLTSHKYNSDLHNISNNINTYTMARNHHDHFDLEEGRSSDAGRPPTFSSTTVESHQLQLSVTSKKDVSLPLPLHPLSLRVQIRSPWSIHAR